MSWEGIKVRNTATGKTGTVRTEFQGFGFTGLTVAIDGGGEHYMELCCIGPDRLTKNWEWDAGDSQWLEFTSKEQA